jgi:hypothetical protein
MKMTRRELVGAIAGSAAIALVVVPEIAAQAPATAPTEAKPDYLAASRESHRENSQVLRTFDLPMSTEPAFVFKA